MRNGLNSPWALSPFAHLAEHGNEPPPAETLALDNDRRKVESIIATGALDKFPADARIRIGWDILRPGQSLAAGNPRRHAEHP